MRLSVDIGGTFTDVVLLDDAGMLHTRKALTTPQDRTVGVLDGLTGISEQVGLSLEQLLARTSLFIHGTTVATNLLIERKGARVGLITTDGFRDLLELREGTKEDRYNLREPFPQPLIPRPHRKGVLERVRWDGSVEQRLDEDDLGEVVGALCSEGVESLVVSFLNAHRNPDHELRARELILRKGWKAYISLGHEILAQEGEYDRLSSAVVNSYVGPGLERYLSALADRLRETGLRVPLMSMQSTGGTLPAGHATHLAVGSLLSGPAGGAMAGAHFARLAGEERMVTYDMGGTSTDICIINAGRPLERHKTDFGDVKVVAPTLDVSAIGAGGGSVAKIDRGGIIDVGPESAGSAPGPACYERGGEFPTVTDANLILGYVSPDTFLGGRIKLSRQRAVDAVKVHIADPLGISVEDASLSINALANARIAEGIRAATVRRGLDPRDFVLFSFGGAGGTHADMVSRELLIPRTIIPREASVLSALGFLSSDVRHDFSVPLGRTMDDLRRGELQTAFDKLEAEARSLLATEGFSGDRVRIVRKLDCRYHRQVFSVEVEVHDRDMIALNCDWLVRKFEDAYRALYQHSHDNVPGFIDTCRVAAFGVQPPLVLKKSKKGASNPESAMRGRRKIYVGKPVEAPIYWFDSLAAGMTIQGPAVVDSASTSVLIADGSIAEVDEFGSIHIVRWRQ